MPRASQPQRIEELTPEALGYLKALRLAADDSCASESETETLSAVFFGACSRFGLDASTVAACIEVLC